MKKGLFIMSLLCFSVGLMAQETKEEKVKGVHPYKLEENEEIAPEFAHWSLIPHIGFSSFDGDFTGEKKHSMAVPSLGIGLEYNFTPVWSVGVEYMYDMYTVTGITGYQMANADTLLTGHMHKAGAYLAMDVINLFFPRVKKKIVSIHPYVGGGVAWYKRAKYYFDDRYYDAEKRELINPTHARGNTANYINADGEVGPDSDKGYQSLGYIQAGLNVDFNLNRTLALGLRANYSYFTRDYMDGRGYHKGSVYSYASKNNDGIYDITLNLRCKLEAVSKSHVRNMPSFDTWEQKPVLKPVHDTVIIHRHDSVIYRESVRVEEKERDNSQYYYVYFPNNVSDLDDKGLVTIQQVADRLNEDEELYAVVTGFCDNTGSNNLNYALGDKRAANVIEELRYEYGVPNNHLYAMGLGKVVGRGKQAAAYAPNRRAQIRLVDKETFERLKANLDEKKEMRVVDLQTIPISESARKAQINTYRSRRHTSVTAEKNTTLSRLAKKYYDNMYCWVYLYMANIDRIENPNAITEGSVLIVPELTAEELKITKEESLVLYGMSRQFK